MLHRPVVHTIHTSSRIRYLIHTQGATYSAGLRYTLACGSVVFIFENKYQEFYYPALEPGVHYVSLPEGDEETLQNKIFPRMKETIAGLEGVSMDLESVSIGLD